MPELPEVETIAQGVHQRLRGDWIEGTWFSEKPEPFRSPPHAMAEALPGKRIERIYRVGKHIVFDLSNGDLSDGNPGEEPRKKRNQKGNGKESRAVSVQWIVHLGMTGRLLVAEPDVPVPAHTHGILRLRSGRELRFVDPRRFGRMGLHPLDPNQTNPDQAGAVQVKGFSGSGVEPLGIAAEAFAALFRGRRTPIKSALLNQKLLHGVGNIYADESLFRAGIRPRRMAGQLTRKELEGLRASLQKVLKEAIALGGSSVSDYVDASGKRGFFQLEHRVYLRTGQPCLVCGTPIRRVVVARRSTHFCPVCQK